MTIAPISSISSDVHEPAAQLGDATLEIEALAEEELLDLLLDALAQRLEERRGSRSRRGPRSGTSC